MYIYIYIYICIYIYIYIYDDDDDFRKNNAMLQSKANITCQTNSRKFCSFCAALLHRCADHR